jgi:hypothetical protein
MQEGAFMDNPFVIAGLACLIAAIVGGGLRFLGVEVPLLKSRIRQAVLGIVGVLLLIFGLGVVRLPKHVEPQKPVTLIRAWTDGPQAIGPNEGTGIRVSAMTGGTCESTAMVSIRDASGGRFQPSGTTAVNGQLDDHCEFLVLWALAPENRHPTQQVYHDMQVEVTKDGATIGTAQVSVLVHP